MSSIGLRLGAYLAPAMPPFATDPTIACNPGNAHLFHAPVGERAPQRRTREADARKICRPCPRRDDCAAYACANKVDGLWGGLSETQRGIRRKPHRATATREAAA